MSRKGENIYKRKDGRWEGRYIKERIPHQKPRYGYVYANSYNEVKSKLINAKLEQTLVEKPIPNNQSDNTTALSVEAIAYKWLNYKKTQVKESTYNKYYISVKKYILPYIGSIKLHTLDKQTLDSFTQTLLTKGKKNHEGLSPKTVSDVISILKNILNYAEDCGYKVNNNGKSVHIHQTHQEIVVFDRSEQKNLCEYLIKHPNLKNMGIMLTLFTGLRIGELCALKWENISLQGKSLYVCQTVQRLSRLEDNFTENKVLPKTYLSVSPPKSACSLRTIPLPDQLVTLLKPYEQTEGYFLTGKNDIIIEPRNYQNHFKRILKCCNIKEQNFHVLRHTFATRCIELNFDVKTLSEILGHASINITMNRYVHPSMDTKRTNMDKLNTLF